MTANVVVPMQQQAVAVYGERSLTAADVRAQVNLIQDVMRSVMIEGTHYGKIPGTQSTSLYKAGAEKLMSTFRLSAHPEVDDLSTPDEVHYRVMVHLRSASGQDLGAGIGECSSSEEKYNWRRPVCDEEYDVTPENRRRVKFVKANGSVYQNKQVRTNPSDVRNTVLKMAKKRAQVDAVITVTAASDIFTQDIEDLPDELREQIADDVRGRTSPGKQAVERAKPAETPERIAAVARCRELALKGTAAFREFWAEWDKDSRALVKDRMDDFKAIAEAVDEQNAKADTTEGA